MKKFDFRVTKTAKEGYRILSLKRVLEVEGDTPFGEVCVFDFSDSVLVDGNRFVMVCQKRTWEDFVDEVLEENNDSAELFEMFVTQKGNKVIYWYDNETGEDFITIYQEGGESNESR